MADVCRLFTAHAWKTELCSTCMKSRELHLKGPVPAKRASKSSKRATSDLTSVEKCDRKPQTDEEKIAAKITPSDCKASEVKQGPLADANEKTSKSQDKMIRSTQTKPTNLSDKKTTEAPPEGDVGSGIADKPTIASKPRPSKTKPQDVRPRKTEEIKPKDRSQSKAHGESNHESTTNQLQTKHSTDEMAASAELTSGGSGPQSGKSKPRQTHKSGTRPQAPPPHAPVSNKTITRASGDQDNKHKGELKVHIKGLSGPSTNTDTQSKDTSSGETFETPSSDRKENNAKNNVGMKRNDGSHYYHTYDITGSLNRSTGKPTDKVKERVKEDSMTAAYRIVDVSNHPIADPYNVVDVTSFQQQCQDTAPPKLPKSLPPGPSPLRVCSSEPSSREGSWKKSKSKQKAISTSSGSVHTEDISGRKMPFILQEEAARMREESKSPPPARKVPIMIPPHLGNSSDTYEQIDDPNECTQFDDDGMEELKTHTNIAESAESLDPDSDFSDYSQSNVGCLSFSRHSKARLSSPKSNSLEAKKAALSNLDLLKGTGISGKEMPNIGTSQPEIVEANVDVLMNDIVNDNIIKEISSDTTKSDKNKKVSKSFFKKLLKIGNKESTSVCDHTSDEVSQLGAQESLHIDIATAAGLSKDGPGLSSSVHTAPRKPVSAREDRQAMFVEFQNALAKRKASAPDICRELSVQESEGATHQHENSVPSSSIETPEHESGASEAHDPIPMGALTKKKKNMNIQIQPVSPKHGEKINNIQQAEEMARSLGIDKVSPRNKTAPQIKHSEKDVRGAVVCQKPSKPAKPGRSSPIRQGNTSDRSTDSPPNAKVLPQVQTTKQTDVPVKVPRSSTLERKKGNDLNKTSKNNEMSNYDKTMNVPTPNSKPTLATAKPNISQKNKVNPIIASTNSIDEQVTDMHPVCSTDPAPLPDLSQDTVLQQHSGSDMHRSSHDSLGSPTGTCNDSGSMNYSRECDGVSVRRRPVSPPSNDTSVSARKPRPMSEVRTGKLSRNRMPAPPPPPAVPTSPGGDERPQSPPPCGSVNSQSPNPTIQSKDGLSPDHKPSCPGSKRPGGLRTADISGPMPTTFPDRMTRSMSSPGDKTGDDMLPHKTKMDSVSKHSRNKTVSGGIEIDMNPTSPDKSTENHFDTLGKRTSKFLNRALPPTPGEANITTSSRGARGKTTARSPQTSLIQENEYELVSLDGDAEERTITTRPVERPAYEDIDVDGPGIYSDPLELLRDPLVLQTSDDVSTKEQSEGVSKSSIANDRSADDYLEPVSGSGDEEKPIPFPRVVGKRQPSPRPRNHHRDRSSIYTNVDIVRQLKPTTSITDGFLQMCSMNVETLSTRMETILNQLLPHTSQFMPELRWSDFSIKGSIPVIEIDEIAVYEMRNAKLKPHDGYLMVSSESLSQSVLEWRCCSTIVPIAMFKDKISSEFFPRSRRKDSSYYHMSAPEETTVAVLGYSSISTLDAWITDLDCVFTSDLTEYERRSCLLVSQVISAILNLTEKWQNLQTFGPGNILVVTMPSSGRSHPIVVVPDMVSGNLDTDGASAKLKATPDWEGLGTGMLGVLFRILRLDYKSKNANLYTAIPIRTKYSYGIQKCVQELTRPRDNPTGHSLITVKLLIHSMLWGPDQEQSKSLLNVEEQHQSFQMWLEVRRCAVVNDLAMGAHHNTLEFANMLWFFCSVTGRMLLESTKLLYG